MAAYLWVVKDEQPARPVRWQLFAAALWPRDGCQMRPASTGFLGGEQEREPDEGESGELFCSLAQPFVEVRAKSETDLGEKECLRADQEDGEP